MVRVGFGFDVGAESKSDKSYILSPVSHAYQISRLLGLSGPRSKEMMDLAMEHLGYVSKTLKMK